jgi:hypothetical protein
MFSVATGQILIRYSKSGERHRKGICHVGEEDEKLIPGEHEEKLSL